ncbi:MAG: hypothetical protein MAG431_00301 [Chloroflexi bacterium]|nr:hypothetical protein [Chloroflexota bacterium]
MPVKISQKGWVVIPVELRRKYNLSPGKKMHVIDYGGVLSLVPVLDDPIENAAGLLTGGDSLTQALLEERREERRREG